MSDLTISLSGSGAEEFADAVERAALSQLATTLGDFERAVTEAARGARDELKRTSPYREGTGRTHYREGWTFTVEKLEAGLGGVRAVIHNRRKWQLTHLLESGHDVVREGKDGRRVVGHAGPIVHIRTARANALRKLLGG